MATGADVVEKFTPACTQCAPSLLISDQKASVKPVDPPKTEWTTNTTLARSASPRGSGSDHSITGAPVSAATIVRLDATTMTRAPLRRVAPVGVARGDARAVERDAAVGRRRLAEATRGRADRERAVIGRGAVGGLPQEHTVVAVPELLHRQAITTPFLDRRPAPNDFARRASPL